MSAIAVIVADGCSIRLSLNPAESDRSNTRFIIISSWRAQSADFPNPRPQKLLRRGQVEMARPIKIGLCPGAEYGPAKRWLPERFAEVAAAVSAQSPVQWTLFGTAGDHDNGAVIEGMLGPACVNRIGKTTLSQLIAELRECALLLTNDTGTMHLATLLDVPVVAVFGSTEPRLTGPLGSRTSCHSTSGGVQPLFPSRMPDRFSVYESD